MNRFLALVLMSFASHMCMFAQNIVEKTACGGASQFGVVVDSPVLDPNGIERFGKQLLESHRSSKLLYAVVGSTKLSVLQSLRQSEVRIVEPMPGMASDEPERAVRRSALAFERGLAIAAVVRIEGDAIVASWGGGTSRGHIQLAGKKDPTALFPGYSLLHVNLFQAKAGALGAAITPCSMTLYFSSNRDPSDSDGADVLRHFQRLFPAIKLTVMIRTDAWFLDDLRYPDVPALPEHLALPDVRKWRESGQLICGPNEWPHDATPICRFVRRN